jgi:predicted nucleic acid-binding protein
MEKNDSLLDTGVLVGLLHKNDQHHEWAERQFDRMSPPLYSYEAVLSEAFHLLEPVPTGSERLLEMLDREIFDFSFSYSARPARVRRLMRTYTDPPMSFADACLVCMAEEQASSQIVTTDDDFRVYRPVGTSRSTWFCPVLSSLCALGSRSLLMMDLTEDGCVECNVSGPRS